MADWTGVRGKRVVITGATNGIGLAACEALAARGARLSIVARDDARARETVRRIEDAGGADADVFIADLSSQRSVRALAAEIVERHSRVDVLVNNAGAIYQTRALTEDGIERTWALNHLAPFLLTTLLLERLRESAPSRVVTTTSDAHKGAHIAFDDLNAERSYRGRGFGRYGETKLANILFTVELARRLEGAGITANCFHPGLVSTGFNRNNGSLMSLAMLAVKPFSRSPGKGAETLVWLTDAAELADQSGGYYVDCTRTTPSSAATDMDAARRLWEVSEEQTSVAAAGGH